jgi:elongation factor Ts
MSVAISAGLVKELRDQTGAGMMDAKRALVDAGGDIEAARTLLRERGMASAQKREGRETTEGIVLLKADPDDGRGSLVAIGCETEPVSKNDEFRVFAQRVLEAAYSTYLAEKADELDEDRKQLIGKIGENIAFVGTVTFEAVDGGVIDGYVHPPANKLGALVQLRGGDAELAKRVAMHIAWSDPRWVSRDDAPSDLVEAEREIYASSDEVQSKPEQAREKIVEGMMNKRFFAERGGALLDQPWIHDSAQTVAQALGDAEVLEFERFALAG